MSVDSCFCGRALGLRVIEGRIAWRCPNPTHGGAGA